MKSWYIKLENMSKEDIGILSNDIHLDYYSDEDCFGIYITPNTELNYRTDLDFWWLEDMYTVNAEEITSMREVAKRLINEHRENESVK